MIKKHLIFIPFVSIVAVFSIIAQNPEKYFIRNFQKNGMLYFIKPVEFSSVNSDYNLIVDFTMIKKNKESDSVTMNFSFYTNDPVSGIDSVIIATSGKNLTILTTGEKFFTQKEKKNWHNRFSYKITFSAFKKFILANSHQITLHIKKEKYIYIPSRKKKKYFQVLNDLINELEYN